ncbi:MAG: peptidase [Paramuribaculum sp.]|nr:peptidase [Paramuribaculum sp.]
MYSFQWTVKVIKPVGKLPVGAWVKIVKTTTTMKPTMLEIFKAFEKKYGVKVPSVSDQNFDIRKDFGNH